MSDYIFIINHHTKHVYSQSVSDYGEITLVDYDDARNLFAFHIAGNTSHLVRSDYAYSRAVFAVFEATERRIIDNEREEIIVRTLDGILQWPTRGYKPGTKGYGEPLSRRI